MRSRYELSRQAEFCAVNKIRDSHNESFSLSLPSFLQFAHVARSSTFFWSPLHIIGLSIYPLLCHFPAASIPREILNSACMGEWERENGERSQERKIRHGQNGGASSVACILINCIDIAARNLVLLRDDDTPVLKVTIVEKTVRQIELSLFRMPIVRTIVVVLP